MTILDKLIAERENVRVEPTDIVIPSRAMDYTIDRLAAQHGGVRVRLYRQHGRVVAYVRSERGDRYEVSDVGVAKPLFGNDRAPYDESETDA